MGAFSENGLLELCWWRLEYTSIGPEIASKSLKYRKTGFTSGRVSQRGLMYEDVIGQGVGSCWIECGEEISCAYCKCGRDVPSVGEGRNNNPHCPPKRASQRSQPSVLILSISIAFDTCKNSSVTSVMERAPLRRPSQIPANMTTLAFDWSRDD